MYLTKMSREKSKCYYFPEIFITALRKMLKTLEFNFITLINPLFIIIVDGV